MEFGKLKCMILANLAESYEKNDKSKIGKILKLIKENKDFKDLYVFYEDFENTTINKPKEYLNKLGDILSEKMDNIGDTYKKLETLMSKDIEYEYNPIYEGLDLLTKKYNLNNINQKNESLELLENHLISEKQQINESDESLFTESEGLLKNILVNNFNVLYESNLEDSEKITFKEIMSLSNDELPIKYNELKENLMSRIDSLINENVGNVVEEKLNDVKTEIITNKEINRINFLKLKELYNEII